VFGVGIGAQAWHASIDGAHAADRLALAETVFYRPNVAPLVRNALAWEIATEPGAPPVLLRWGRALADQGARQQRNIDGRSRIYAAVVDTEAVLEYRLGDPVRATRLEAELPWRLQPMGSHLALFLDTLLRERGSQVVGEEGPPAPAITVENGVLRLSQPAPAPQGARVYAVLRGRNGLAGVLFFHLPPNFSGTQILPLPGSQGAPGMAAPDPVWTDGRTTIEVGLFDRRGCYCSWPEMGPHFAPYTPDPDISP
jgi:hypothetical protein